MTARDSTELIPEFLLLIGRVETSVRLGGNYQRVYAGAPKAYLIGPKSLETFPVAKKPFPWKLWAPFLDHVSTVGFRSTGLEIRVSNPDEDNREDPHSEAIGQIPPKELTGPIALSRDDRFLIFPIRLFGGPLIKAGESAEYLLDYGAGNLELDHVMADLRSQGFNDWYDLHS